MYFEDDSVLECHLNNDWAVFLRNLKKREECHYELLQYFKTLLYPNYPPGCNPQVFT